MFKKTPILFKFYQNQKSKYLNLNKRLVITMILSYFIIRTSSQNHNFSIKWKYKSITHTVLPKSLILFKKKNYIF